MEDIQMIKILAACGRLTSSHQIKNALKKSCRNRYDVRQTLSLVKDARFDSGWRYFTQLLQLILDSILVFQRWGSRTNF